MKIKNVLNYQLSYLRDTIDIDDYERLNILISFLTPEQMNQFESIRKIEKCLILDVYYTFINPNYNRFTKYFQPYQPMKDYYIGANYLIIFNQWMMQEMWNDKFLKYLNYKQKKGVLFNRDYNQKFNEVLKKKKHDMMIYRGLIVEKERK